MHEQKNKLMKSIIPRLAILVLAAFALAGCNQNPPSHSTDVPSTNSSASTASRIPNLPATNVVADMNTNLPAGTNQ
jgi:hypothetical protein